MDACGTVVEQRRVDHSHLNTQKNTSGSILTGGSFSAHTVGVRQRPLPRLSAGSVWPLRHLLLQVLPPSSSPL